MLEFEMSSFYGADDDLLEGRPVSEWVIDSM